MAVVNHVNDLINALLGADLVHANHVVRALNAGALSVHFIHRVACIIKN
jgi:hypothetical protein